MYDVAFKIPAFAGMTELYSDTHTEDGPRREDGVTARVCMWIINKPLHVARDSLFLAL
jgi:hypothetical protein